MQSEDRMLSEFHLWVWTKYPELRRLCFHPLNEGDGDPVIGSINKAKGVVAGVCDYVCLVRGSMGEPGLMLEFKTTTGVLGPKQKAFRDRVLEQGYTWHLVWSVEEAKAVWEAYMG